MSSNIYEKPHFPRNVRYSKGSHVDRGERMEKVVDIYESVDDFGGHRSNSSTRCGGGPRTQRRPPAVRRNPFKAATVVLGLLCLVLVIGITFLIKLYMSIYLERDELKINYSSLEHNYTQLQTNKLCGGSYPEGWERFERSCYYKSTEKGNWTYSRADCVKRKADLVIIKTKAEQDFISKQYKGESSWIGLKHVKKDPWGKTWEWQWVDKSQPIHTSWATGQSLNLQEELPVSINQEGLWMADKDTSKKQWICEREVS